MAESSSHQVKLYGAAISGYANIIHCALKLKGVPYDYFVGLTYVILSSEGDAQRKAAEEYREHMITLEDGVREDLWSGGPFINGESPGLLDLVVGSGRDGIACMGELAGVKLVEKERMPLLCSVMEAFVKLDAVKEVMIPKEVHMKYILAIREKISASSA
ncbi:hypothetical protein Cni_G07606 [Canna indica]|uniref:Uncharacterized protein n=1 Tax=Canna indica TaxID=4628 RepID=A0AAQ3K0N3_9LILI|nr:hypothetical protein Cni_G07606 [Canna indica]